MPQLRSYSVFISHAWQYSDDYYRAVQLLDGAQFFSWQNLSVPEHDPIADRNRLEGELRNQMRPAHAFLIIAGMYVAHSDWIQFEIDFARRIARPIIGIRPWGSQLVPVAVQNAASEVVGWTTDSIVSAIRRHALAD